MSLLAEPIGFLWPASGAGWNGWTAQPSGMSSLIGWQPRHRLSLIGWQPRRRSSLIGWQPRRWSSFIGCHWLCIRQVPYPVCHWLWAQKYLQHELYADVHTSRLVILLSQQCFGSASIRINLVHLDPDPLWQCGSGTRPWAMTADTGSGSSGVENV